MKDFSGRPDDENEYEYFVVTTNIGYKFAIPAKVFKENFETLMKWAT
jgi:hypothetical protein